MYEHKVVGPINQVKNNEDAWEEVESNLKVKDIINQIHSFYHYVK